MLLLIDNYDSFTYNLVQYFEELGVGVTTVRNDKITPAEMAKLEGVSHIVLSPGPCTPKQTGVSKHAVKIFCGKVPILGVCIGHQTVAEMFGWLVVRARVPVHGKNSLIHHDGKGVYQGVPSPFAATRYHSLVVRPEGENQRENEHLVVSAWTDDGTVMGIRHKRYRIEGMQYHPEALLTACGKDLLRNFLGQQGGQW